MLTQMPNYRVGAATQLLRKRSTRFVDACAGPCGDSDHTHCVISSDRLRILHRWDRSRLSAAAFAPSVGLSAWTLYSWRRQARLAEAPSPGSPFIELAPRDEPTHATDRTSDNAFELSLPRGITLRVAPGTDPAELRRIVDALVG